MDAAPEGMDRQHQQALGADGGGFCSVSAAAAGLLNFSAIQAAGFRVKQRQSSDPVGSGLQA